MLRIEPGIVVGLCGSTGAGKTTLLRTLLGLEAAVEGEILYGGARLTEAPAGPRHRPFAWVPQDAPLIADTLDANVLLGAPEYAAADDMSAASPEPGRRLEAALGEVGGGPLAARLGAQPLGPGGRMVSGGERQWIALARAVATGQPVLLLDEPTSGLDAESQRRVLAAIERLRGARTVVLVTHRREPLAIADVVIRVGEGGQSSVVGRPAAVLGASRGAA
jgi:ABC-type transport system involved in cytochrome bd biosynthesis fused ATPase/permease subunit